jgi:catechol 2,3-dioxygenase-like lactoylglutathione lyase family enzyme
MIRVKKIAHAVYEMPDVDKQAEYYTEVLGLTQTGKDKESVYLASTVDHHSVVLCKGPQAKCVRLGFQLAPEDDLDAFEKEVQGHGIKTQRRRDAEPTISDMVTFADPKGTVMEVFKRDAFAGQRFPSKGIVPPSSATSRSSSATSSARRISTVTCSAFASPTGWGTSFRSCAAAATITPST